MPLFGKKNFGDSAPVGQTKASGGWVPTRNVNRMQPGAGDAERPPGLHEDGGTRPVDLSKPAPLPVGGQQNKAEPKTRLLRPQGSAGNTSSQPTPMDDPVVGWIVVVAGPGKGASRPLGYGMNAIGRASDSRICLDFGDERISRTNHAILTYDQRGRKFFIQHGGGINLTYLEDQPVLAPMELKGGELILMGETQVCFIPFCGAGFDWQDGP